MLHTWSQGGAALSTYKGAVLAMEEETTHVLEGRALWEAQSWCVFILREPQGLNYEQIHCCWKGANGNNAMNWQHWLSSVKHGHQTVIFLSDLARGTLLTCSALKDLANIPFSNEL